MMGKKFTQFNYYYTFNYYNKIYYFYIKQINKLYKYEIITDI